MFIKRISIGLATPFCVELLGPEIVVGIEYRDFMKGFDKVYYNILENSMNKNRLVIKIIG